MFGEETKAVRTNVPFFKDNELDYADLITWAGEGMEQYAWIIFIPVVILIVTAVSNGANLTDGIDGLAAGSSAIIVLTWGILPGFRAMCNSPTTWTFSICQGQGSWLCSSRHS